ncbi:hypothetical protein KSD_28230 [Ktedonobacter sp. SOSP1-85]|nr:hypothetical protein KSD_28230 [Ktedonobacter sp. SOSP1-85]
MYCKVCGGALVLPGHHHIPYSLDEKVAALVAEFAIGVDLSLTWDPS